MAWALFLSISLCRFVYCKANSHAEYEPPYGEKLNPKPFKYDYGLHSSSSDVAFSKKETQDEKGNIYGEVVVSLPDGRIQTTNYIADFYDGYTADVKYAITPQYHQHQSIENRRPSFSPFYVNKRPSPTKMPFKPVYKERKPFLNPTYPVFKNFPYRKEPKVFLPYEKTPTNKEHMSKDTIVRKIPGIFSQKSKQNTRRRPKSFGNYIKPTQDALGKTVVKSKKEPISIPQSITNTQNVKLKNPTLTNQVKAPVLVKKSHTIPRPNDKMEKLITKTKEYPGQKVPSNSNAVMQIKSYVKSPMQIISHVIHKRKRKLEYLTKKGKESDVQKVLNMKVHPIQIKSSFAKTPIRNSVMEFMRKVKLMKERESKSTKLKTHFMPDIAKKELTTKKPLKHSKVELMRNVKLMKERENELPNLKNTHSISNINENELTMKKPLRPSVAEFIRKVKLMKQKKMKQSQPIISVTSTKVQETNQDYKENTSMNIHSRIIPLQHFDFEF